MKRFSEKLKLLLERNALSQAKAAELLGVNQKTISNWINGKILPNLGKIRNIAIALKIDPYILTDDSRELPSLTFKEHLDTLKHSGDVSRSVFPEDENRAAGFAEALMGAGLAIKTIPIIEDRLVKLESGMAQILEFLKNENPKSLKINSPKISQCETFDQTDNSAVHLKSSETGHSVTNLDTLGKRIEKMEAVLAKLIDAANAGNRAASLDEIAEARKMADKLSVDISARKRKKNA
jgi:hypothetical protein